MAGTVFHGTYRNGIILANPNTQNPATIAASGYVTGSSFGVLGKSPVAWNLTNLGRIKSTATGTGIYLQHGGNITNGSIRSSAASITAAGGTAIAIDHGAGKLTNFGTIENSTPTRVAVYLSGGSVLNGRSGSARALIESPSNAVLMRSAAGSVANFGTIESTGRYSAIYLGAGGTLDNQGVVRGVGGAAVSLGRGGKVINGRSAAAGGLISAKSSAVLVTNRAGTITNFGSIASTTTVLSGGSLHSAGVVLAAGGTLVNGAAGDTDALVTAAEGCVYAGGIGGAAKTGAVGSVVNYGTIRSTGRGSVGATAILMVSGGRVINHGRIESAAQSAVAFRNKAGTVTNFGTIAGTAAGAAIDLEKGGIVTNVHGGRITAGGSASAVACFGAAGTIANFGLIANAGFGGVYFGAGGAVANHGTIETQATANAAVSFHHKAGTVSNSGVIGSTGNQGLYFGTGGSITNLKGGVVRGGTRGTGIDIAGGAVSVENSGTFAGQTAIYARPTDTAPITVTNSGAILGSKAAIAFGAGNDRLIDAPGARFLGVVSGGKGSNTLELAAGSGAGNIFGLGTGFVDFATVEFDARSRWTLGVAAPADFGETIKGFAPGDTIDLAGIKATSQSFSKGVLTLSNGGAALARFAMPGQPATVGFTLAPDGHGGTDIRIGAAAPIPRRLSFDLTFDASVAHAPTGFEAAVKRAATLFSSDFDDPITVSLDIGWGEIGGAGGGTIGSSAARSNTNLTSTSFSALMDALRGDASSAADNTVQHHLPADPAGTGQNFAISDAETKALGLAPASGQHPDGWIGIGTGFDPSDPNFIGVVAHEISEVLGRTSGISSATDAFSGHYTLLDLFRYSSSTHRPEPSSATDPKTGKGTYFSIDGGTTPLNVFSSLADPDKLSPPDDPGADWAGLRPDAFNAAADGGVTLGDIIEMDILGYDRTPLGWSVVARDGPLGERIAVAGHGAAGDPVTLFDGAAKLGSTMVGSGGSWSIGTKGALAPGLHHLAATESDVTNPSTKATQFLTLTIPGGSAAVSGHPAQPAADPDLAGAQLLFSG